MLIQSLTSDKINFLFFFLCPAIYAKEQAKTKKLVGNVLALNLVSQLYQMGAIEAARAPGTKKNEIVVCEMRRELWLRRLVVYVGGTL